MQTPAEFVYSTPLATPAVRLPDGEYGGVWSAYSVEVVHDSRRHHFRTADGVRGINVPCRVTVVEGKATVEVDDWDEWDAT